MNYFNKFIPFNKQKISYCYTDNFKNVKTRLLTLNILFIYILQVPINTMTHFSIYQRPA